MCTYQRWGHSNGSVEEFWACGEFLELKEGGMGKRKAPHMALYLHLEVVCAPIIFCSIHMEVAHVGSRW